MSRRFASVLLPLLLAPTMSAAQAPDSLVKGQRVRVATRCDVLHAQVLRCPATGQLWTYTGRLEALEGDSLHIRIQSGDPEMVIPASAITSMSVVDGTRGHFWTGAGLGLVGGAVLGAAIGSTMQFCIFSCSPATGIGAFFGAPVGFLVGGIIGSKTRSDRWRSISVDMHGIRVAPRLDAPGFTMTLTF